MLTFLAVTATTRSLSKVPLVDQRMCLAVSAFANCGRAVAHVRGSYGPIPEFQWTFCFSDHRTSNDRIVSSKRDVRVFHKGNYPSSRSFLIYL